MTKKFNKLLLLSVSVFSLVACEMFSTPKDENLTQVDASELNEYQAATGKTYYKSDLYEMHSTIAGYFDYGRPFTIENDNQNVHIYDELYLYQGDEFFIAKNKARSKGDFLPNFDYCFELKEKADEEFVNVDVAEGDPTCGSLFVKEGKDGVYKVTFDVGTKLIDLEYLREIDTPRYDYIKHCDISEIHFKKTTYKTLRENPENKDELCILNYDIPMHASIIFDNNLGCYTRVWLDDSYFNMARTFTKRDLVYFSVGGTYNVYLNRKTYNVRLELANEASATYNCFYVFYGGNDSADPIALEQDQTNKHIFRLNNFNNESATGFYRNISFVSTEVGVKGTYKYRLTPTNDNIELLESDRYAFKSGGTFNIEINLKENTITANKIS